MTDRRDETIEELFDRGLEVRRASLEDSYMALVRRVESTPSGDSAERDNNRASRIQQQP